MPERTFDEPGASYMNAMAKTSIGLLASEAIAGDPRALTALLDELAPLVVRTTRLIVGSGSVAAEDAAQDALVDITRRIATLREPEAVIAWATRIAARRALRTARWERLRWRNEVQLVDAPWVRDVSDDRRRALGVAFDRLPPRQRAIAVLRLYVGLSEGETAHALGLSIGAVKSQLHAARRRLSNSLREAGYEPQTRSPSAAKGTA
jgi:RNA polymerase sigma factor (sigma-70 family)